MDSVGGPAAKTSPSVRPSERTRRRGNKMGTVKKIPPHILTGGGGRALDPR